MNRPGFLLVLEGLIKYLEALPLLWRDEHATLVPECRAIAQRLGVHRPVNEGLKSLAVSFDLTHPWSTSVWSAMPSFRLTRGALVSEN